MVKIVSKAQKAASPASVNATSVAASANEGDRKSVLCADIERLIDGKTSGRQRDSAKAFAARYYSEINADDFIARDAASCSAVSLTHLQFGQEFKSSTAKIAT